MSIEKSEEDQLKDDPKIKDALVENQKPGGQAPDKEDRAVTRSSRLWIFIILMVSGGLLYVLTNAGFIPVQDDLIPLLRRLFAGFTLIMVVLVIHRLLRAYIVNRIGHPTTRYNLRRINDLAATLVILFIIISIVSSNWYTIVVSLGLISLILGLALQNPITSFFGWIYILIRKPFEVGDRIKIGSVTGDVISLSYFDTTLWEFRGDYISLDHPSGRVIRFANSRVFNEYIINYSWPLFPYLWKEIKFYVAYQSDLHFIENTLRRVIQEEIGEEMKHRVDLYRSILKETPVDELEVRAGGSVNFNAHQNAWIEVIAIFLAEPKQSGAVKSRLFRKMMIELQRNPDKVIFPKPK